jgi:hypothetical protein
VLSYLLERVRTNSDSYPLVDCRSETLVLLRVFPQANAARLNQRRARSSPLNEFYLTIIFTAGMRHLAASGLNAGRLVGWSAGRPVACVARPARVAWQAVEIRLSAPRSEEWPAAHALCRYRKPMEIQGIAIKITSAMNSAVRCGHTRPIATSGDTRPIAHAA